MGILEGGKVHICVQSSVLNHTFLEIFVFVFSMFTFVLQILESTLQIFKKILIVCLFWQCFFFFFSWNILDAWLRMLETLHL